MSNGIDYMKKVSVLQLNSWPRYDSPNLVDHAVFSVKWSTSKNNLQRKEPNTILNFSPMMVPGVQNICENFHEFYQIYVFIIGRTLNPIFCDHGMEHILGKHSNDEINQELTICLMNTNVPQYKTSISIIIYHSCLLVDLRSET